MHKSPRTSARASDVLLHQPEHELGEGLPVPREPAYAAERNQDGEATAASE